MQGTDGAVGQAGVHAQRKIGGTDHLVHHKLQGVGQALAAVFKWRVQRGPAALNEFFVGVLEAVRSCH